MARCVTCNDLTTEGLPERTPDPPWGAGWVAAGKAFEIKKKVKDFKSTSKHGCKQCVLVLQAITSYLGSKAAKRLSTDWWDDVNIKLRSDCNEPLSISLDYSEPYVRIEFELFEEAESCKQKSQLYSAIGHGANPPKVLELESAARLSRKWVEQCNTGHQCCQRDDLPLPTRVLEIGQGVIKLIITKPSSSGRYVALSYCWGRSGNITTTSANLHEHMAGIEWSLLPNLIRDVVQFTQLIGIRYLWIDALCIIQDDRVDWRTESSQMGDIYAGAYVTIATDGAVDTAKILTSPRCSRFETSYDRTPLLEEPLSLEKVSKVRDLPATLSDGHHRQFYTREPYPHGDILESSAYDDFTYPLNTRGWTMQERLLSRRLLHFGAYEMIWECDAALHCECGGISQDKTWVIGHDAPRMAFEKARAAFQRRHMDTSSHATAAGQYIQNPDFAAAWTNLVSMFAGRQLTYETDKLPALSALAQRFSTGKCYLAGSWLEDLPWYLVWMPREIEPLPYKTKVYVGPSWSWTSTAARIVHWASWTREAKSLITISEASTEPLSFNKFGEVTGGWIRLTGLVGCATLRKKKTSLYVADLHGGTKRFTRDVGCRFSEYWKDSKSYRADQRLARRMEDGEDVWCIILFDDVVKPPGFHRRRHQWVMVTARPSRASLKRSLPTATLSDDILVCERIGYMDIDSKKETSSKYIQRTDFEVKQVILI